MFYAPVTGNCRSARFACGATVYKCHVARATEHECGEATNRNARRENDDLFAARSSAPTHWSTPSGREAPVGFLQGFSWPGHERAEPLGRARRTANAERRLKSLASQKAILAEGLGAGSFVPMRSSKHFGPPVYLMGGLMIALPTIDLLLSVSPMRFGAAAGGSALEGY